MYFQFQEQELVYSSNDLLLTVEMMRISASLSRFCAHVWLSVWLQLSLVSWHPQSNMKKKRLIKVKVIDIDSNLFLTSSQFYNNYNNIIFISFVQVCIVR